MFFQQLDQWMAEEVSSFWEAYQQGQVSVNINIMLNTLYQLGQTFVIVILTKTIEVYRIAMSPEVSSHNFTGMI